MNSIAAKDAMAPPSARSESSSLQRRVLSALALGPAALLAIWLGGWVFSLVVGAAAALMYWEWHGLSAGGPGLEQGPACYGGIAGCFLGPPLTLLGGPTTALAAGVVFAALLAILLRLDGSASPLFRWLGFPYIFVCCVAMVWLRELPALGLETVLWIFVVVIVTDTGAFFTGRAVGGPKLAPRISPKKTWAGLVGGITGAALAGAVVAVMMGASSPAAISALSGALAIVAQIGDLLISRAKRKFAVKDASDLIPGHGGVLDRFDGFLAVSLVMAALVAARGGSALEWL